MNNAQQKIYRYVLDEIINGRLGVDDRVMTEKELSGRFSTTRMNAHFAVKELEGRGILRRNKKHGTVVHSKPTTFMARELKSLVSNKVCVLNSCPESYRHIHWNSRIIDTLEAELKANGTEMIFQDISELKTSGELSETLKTLAKDGVEGLILVPNSRDDLIIKELPVVMSFHQNVYVFDRGIGVWLDWPVHSVTISAFGDGCLAARYLIGRGYKHIAYCPCNDSHSSNEIARGLELGAMRASDGAVKIERWIQSDSPAVIYDKLTGLDKFYALVAYSDQQASEIIDFLAGKKLSVKKDYAIISFDDNPALRKYNLTTIAPPLAEIGRHLAKLIADTAAGENKGITHCVKVESSIIERGTC
jgi:DNA-binding LacI/PurR family transcriptional regulator